MKKLLILSSISFSTLAFSAVAQAISLSGGTHDTTLPVEVTADSLTVDQSTNSATFSGNARVGQGNMRLGANQITVNYNETSGEISGVTALGDVVFTNGTDSAESGSANYDVSSGLLIMKNEVLLLQGRNAISGNTLNLNILENTAKMDGNVKTVLVPK